MGFRQGFLAVFVLTSLLVPVGQAEAYEFHLLNGMVIKGELKSFQDDRFSVTTDFGLVVVYADKLDYIIVDEEDGLAVKGKDCPGVAVLPQGVAGQGVPEPLADELTREEAVEAEASAGKDSVQEAGPSGPPASFDGLADPPTALEDRSIAGAEDSASYRGRFPGGPI